MIVLSTQQLADIHGQAEAAYPYESCGLLVGCIRTDGDVLVTRVIASPNTKIDNEQGSGKDRFEVDPQIRFDLMREIDGRDEDMIGHYHSHPDHPARPSNTDLDMAFEPELIWLITQVDGGNAKTTTAWRLNRETKDITPIQMNVT